LRYLGQIGHVRDSEVALDSLASDHPESAVVVDQLRDHLRRFDLKSYLGLLNSLG
jgi:hypothetical protein